MCFSDGSLRWLCFVVCTLCLLCSDFVFGHLVFLLVAFGFVCFGLSGLIWLLLYSFRCFSCEFWFCVRWNAGGCVLISVWILAICGYCLRIFGGFGFDFAFWFDCCLVLVLCEFGFVFWCLLLCGDLLLYCQVLFGVGFVCRWSLRFGFRFDVGLVCFAVLLLIAFGCWCFRLIWCFCDYGLWCALLFVVFGLGLFCC